MPAPSQTHLVLIPSYNSGPKLESTVRQALAAWSPVWVVIDGSTDGSDQFLDGLAQRSPADLRVLRQTPNSGKGSAVLHGLRRPSPKTSPTSSPWMPMASMTRTASPPS
jgi:glycosyltransferase involved in cell wall biosynthesis